MKSVLDKKEFLDDLKTLIKIKSVRGDCGEETASAPLGKGINDAIEAFLDIGRRFGFKTKNLDGYCGYIEMGEGEELLGIIVHTDTVSSGDGWTYPRLNAQLQKTAFSDAVLLMIKGLLFFLFMQ